MYFTGIEIYNVSYGVLIYIALMYVAICVMNHFYICDKMK